MRQWKQTRRWENSVRYKENFLYCGGGQTLEEMTSWVVGSPFQEVLKTPWDMARFWTCFKQGLRQDDLHKLFYD